ncbi:MAG: hypothetical protein NW200_07230, partial [Hyphomonadaceae bacterium]|nr:hypothetical protein [Hyphomonadaceae bacterium]
PADLALLHRDRWGRTRGVWAAAGKMALMPAIQPSAWAALEAFEVRVFVRAERRELVTWRVGMGRPDCTWVTGDVADELAVAPALWDDVIAALARQTAPAVGAAL